MSEINNLTENVQKGDPHPTLHFRTIKTQTRPSTRSFGSQVKPSRIPDLLLHQNVATDSIYQSSTGSQCDPVPTSEIECECDIPPENRLMWLTEEELVCMRLGKALKDIDPSTFPKLTTQKHIKNSGEEIMRNVGTVISKIKESFGDDAKYTCFKNVAKATSDVCGIGRSTVIRRTPLRVNPPKKRLRDMSKKEKNRHYVHEIDILKRSKIIKEIHEIWKRGKDVVTDELWKWAQTEIEFDKCHTIFLHVLHGLGFVYKKKGENTIVFERKDIIQKRALYLKNKKEWDDKNAYYGSFDETWVYDGMSKKKGWQHANSNMYQRSQLMDLESHQAGPSKGKERGRRVIVAAVLTEDGVLPDSELLLVSGVREEDQAADYHKEMDGDNFEKYYMGVIPLLAEAAKKKGRPAVFICDNAPYHNKAIKKPPISNSSKAEVTSFLTEQGLKFFKSQNRDILIDLAKDFVESNGGRDMFTVYKFDEWAKSHGVTVLRLPQYHCFFNGIELLWAQLKQHLRKEGSPLDTVETVRDRALQFLRAFTAQSAAKLLDHPRKLEQDVREMTLERNLTLEDDDFELLYDIDEDGNLVNIHIGSDEEEGSESEEFDEGDDFGEYEDDDFQYNDEDSLHSDFEMLDAEELEI